MIRRARCSFEDLAIGLVYSLRCVSLFNLPLTVVQDVVTVTKPSCSGR